MFWLSQLGHFHMCPTFCIALFRFCKGPFKRQRAQPTQELSVNLQSKTASRVTSRVPKPHIYLLIVVVAIKCTFLLALFAVDRRAILNLGISTSLALIAYKCSYNVAVLASRRFAVRFDILLTLFAYGASVSFRCLLKFWATISALYHGKSSTTFLGKVKVKNRQRTYYAIWRKYTLITGAELWKRWKTTAHFFSNLTVDSANSTG